MTSLHELESLFWRGVRFDPAPPELGRHIVSRAGLAAADRIALYRRMFWFRQVGALSDCFPVLATMLGERAFAKLASAYVAAHPSEDPALERLGRALPRFVREHPRLTDDAALLADVAEIEWATCASLLAPDVAHPVALSDIPFGEFASAVVELAPHVRLLRVLRDAIELVACQGGGRCTVRTLETETLLVIRPDVMVRTRTPAQDEASALAALAEGQTLGEVCLRFSNAPRPEQRAASVLRGWIDDRMIARLGIPERR